MAPIKAAVNNIISLSDFQELMFHKVVPIMDMTDHKGEPIKDIITMWRRKELLPFIEKGNWLEISFAQLIWIRILDDLRKINFPYTKMKMVCDYFFKDAYDIDLPMLNLDHNKRQIENKKTAGTQTDEDDQLLALINESLKNKALLYTLKFSINYLTNLIGHALSSGEDGSIYIFFDGTVAEFVGNRYAGHKNEEFDFTSPYVHLSIKHYLNEFINEEALSDIIMTQLLNEDEIKVLKEMRRKNIKLIEITNKNDKNSTRIDSTKTGVITAETARKIKQLLGLGNYESITLETMDEKTLSFKHTRKKI